MFQQQTLFENSKIINRGTNAGGSNTNYYGKTFEEKTNNQVKLLENGYSVHSFTNHSKHSKNPSDFYLTKTFEDRTITFVLQNGLKLYIEKKYNIKLWRFADEAYIIEFNSGKKIIKILEKKMQNVRGSVETKLWAGPSLKREYELALGENFEIHYGFCINSFLQKKITSCQKKYTTLNIILAENNISVLFGDDENYFEKLDEWINNSL